MLYGNSSFGYSYSPDRSRDVSHDNLHSQFLGASGSRQTGYYYSPSKASASKSSSTGWYDGAGRYHEG
jgi:hypothetical protein